MRRVSPGVMRKLDFGRLPETRGRLRLVATGGTGGQEKYRILDLKRRRAQIRARRALGLN